MSKEDLININGIREDLYQAMQIGDITLSSKHSQELYDFMNYQDKEIERLNNIINEVRKKIKLTESKERFCIKYIQIDRNRYDSIIKLLDKGV